MDISKIRLADKSEQGSTLIVLDPVTGVETDFKIKLAGTDSFIYRNWLKRMSNKKLGNFKKKGFSYEESERSSVELLAELTLGWEGLEADGEPIVYSREKAMELYSDPNMKWLREQVDEFVGERANFF